MNLKWCCCSRICKLGNAVRLFHFLLTFFIFYLLLTNSNSELYKAWKSHSAYFICLVVLLSFSLLLYLVASLLDPGYQPKMDPALIAEQFSQASLDPSADSTALDISPSTSSLTQDALPLSSGYCRVCRHPQPLRTKHCYQCGRCVRRFDHHCPWLGNCVGERNHKFFWLFLGCKTALLSWGVWIAWTTITGSRDTLSWLRLNLLVFLSLLVVFMSAIIVGLLFLYHSYLMVSGQTTWEQASRHRIDYLKDLQDMSNPFDEGCCCNIARFVFSCCSWFRDWEQVYDARTKSGV